jgi:hypothetical protein
VRASLAEEFCPSERDGWYSASSLGESKLRALKTVLVRVISYLRGAGFSTGLLGPKVVCLASLKLAMNLDNHASRKDR